MRIAILNADYDPFLRELYRRNERLYRASYAEQLSVRNASFFGVADFYSMNLIAIGHDARDFHVNNTPLQAAWMRECFATVNPRALSRHLATAVGGWMRQPRTTLRRLRSKEPAGSPADGWLFHVLERQLHAYKPDVVLNQAMDWIPAGVIHQLRGATRLMVGQIAAPLPHSHDLGPYDLLLSSLPNFVSRFNAAGKPAALQQLGFEPRVLTQVADVDADIPVSFVGSLSAAHTNRIQLIDHLCRETELQVWGYLDPSIPASSPIRARHQGPAWGADMYRILRRSKVSVNQHIDIAGPWANNMRLYEATGVGTALLTDAKDNLDSIFRPGIEVAAYRTAAECEQTIGELLADDRFRRELAAAGQRRTLRDHTYRHRAGELIELLEEFIAE